jgi:hypothetical protein
MLRNSPAKEATTPGVVQSVGAALILMTLTVLPVLFPVSELK